MILMSVSFKDLVDGNAFKCWTGNSDSFFSGKRAAKVTIGMEEEDGEDSGGWFSTVRNEVQERDDEEDDSDEVRIRGIVSEANN